MYVGLYSALARQDVVVARDFIVEQGFRPEPDGIRLCRQAMLAAPDGTPLRRLSQGMDFSTMSGCRDLLFHVKEHRLTLPVIGEFLRSNGLTFLGFDLDQPTSQKYRHCFPQDTAMTDLEGWCSFEQTHPYTFANMYQFWVQKA